MGGETECCREKKKTNIYKKKYYMIQLECLTII